MVRDSQRAVDGWVLNQSWGGSEGARFLVVEDDAGVGAVYRRALRAHGGAIVVASVVEAREALRGLRPAGLIVDVTLPDGCGLAVAREARQAMPGLPILVVSGAVDAWRLDIAHELSAAYLLKPVQIAQIVRFAQRAVGRATESAVEGPPPPPDEAARRAPTGAAHEARRLLELCMRLPASDPARAEALPIIKAILDETAARARLSGRR